MEEGDLSDYVPDELTPPEQLLVGEEDLQTPCLLRVFNHGLGLAVGVEVSTH